MTGSLTVTKKVENHSPAYAKWARDAQKTLDAGREELSRFERALQFLSGPALARTTRATRMARRPKEDGSRRT